jgi:hypothetical protein
MAGVSTIKAQNLSYTLIKDSSSYSSLTGGQILAVEENFIGKKYGIHLPFTFNLCGSTGDSVIIEGNGFMKLDKSLGVSIIAFNSFSSKKDSNQSYISAITYKNDGSAPNRILKVEFANLAQNTLSQTDYFNYQVWLYENGNKIEVHVGPNPYSIQEGFPQILGLINTSMDTENKALFLSGDPLAPSIQLITGENDFEYLNGIPFSGTIYKLTPSF